MKRNALVILCLAILFILTASLAFSQQEWEYPLEDWVFGDISAVDLENNRIVVSYISSDDQEKEIVIGIDEATKFENIGTISDLKERDIVSVDYKITTRGDIIALVISATRLKPLE